MRLAARLAMSACFHPAVLLPPAAKPAICGQVQSTRTRRAAAPKIAQDRAPTLADDSPTAISGGHTGAAAQMLMAKDEMPAGSEQQEKAMQAAAHGRSTLGIPKSVGEEFVGKDGAAAPPLAAGIVFVAPDGEVLLLRRSSTEENYAGHWALPGGKADKGESALDAAVRESVEEIGEGSWGLEREKPRLLMRKLTPNGMGFSTFAAPVTDKFVPKLNGEHSGYAWAGLDMLPQPLHPAVADCLGEHLGVAADMTPDDWGALRTGFAKWTREEEAEPEHAMDERMALDKSVRSYDKDGRLRVERVPITKANVCEYWGHEIPDSEKLGLDPNRKYALLRDPEELKKAAASWNGVQLLIKHMPVNAEDHQPDQIVGSVGTDGEWQDPYVYNSLSVWAREGIDGIEDKSQHQLSSAYHYRADMTPGVFRGIRFDGVMRDISGNHVALVTEGRAGADVVVGDSKLKTKEINMAKVVFTRKGAQVAGALIAYLAPKMAADAKIDLCPILKDVTAKNFKTGKAKIAADLKAAVTLAKDANLDDVTEFLDKLEGCEVTEGADEDPSSGLPMSAEELKKKNAADAKAARDAKMGEFRKGLDEKQAKAFDDMMGEAEAEDEEDDDEEAKKKAAAAKKAANDAEGPEMEPKVSKKAMDAAIATARRETETAVMSRMKGIQEATEAVAPYVGKLAMAHDSAEAIYRTALTTLGMDAADVNDLPLAVLKSTLKVQPKPGDKRAERQLALDAGDGTGFNSRFPAAANIAV